MSFDGMMTRAMSHELTEELVSGRISKIYQPFKNELIIHIRAKGKKHQLLLSAHPSYSRVHLTEESYDNPNEPPMFCMLLRKHLEGSVIEKIEQIDMERILTIEVKSKNEIGDISYKQLNIEIMGRHSNIILVDKERNMILDSIKHISPAVSRERTVLPGQTYVLPPSQDKLNPFTVSQEDVIKKLDFNSGKLDKQFVQIFMGISPLFSQETLHRAGLSSPQTLANTFLSLVSDVNNHDIKPQIISTNNKEYFYILNLTFLGGNVREFSTVSEMLDRFYYGKAERDRVKQQAHDIERFIQNEINKNKKKIKKLEKTLDDAEKADKFQLMGELLTAHLYMVNRGDQEIEVVNYYDEEGGTITIPLDRQKSPSDNAQKYFQKYTKLKNSVAIVQEQIHKAEEEIKYFETLLQQVESASTTDIEEIREELTEEGYLKKKRNTKKQKAKSKKPLLDKYKASDGTEILVGKNNKQNEYLTNRLAGKSEIWLHTKDIPGSHVLIRDENPSEETLLEAAKLAAYYSKAKHSSSVPVDYTQIRHVKKPSGAKPGFVTYDHQKTVFVTPTEDLVLKLKD